MDRNGLPPKGPTAHREPRTIGRVPAVNPEVNDAVSSVEGDIVTFRLADPDHELAGVRLWTDVDLPLASDFEPSDGGWELRLAALPLDRIEYLFEIGDDLIVDPGNPQVVGGAFGDHSWLALPGYGQPRWLELEPVHGTRLPIKVPDTPIGEVTGELWTPGDLDPGVPLPLLISHDGPEMDAYGHITQYVGALIAEGRLPPLRVALLSPGDRNPTYAANPLYAAALVDRVLPGIGEQCLTQQQPVLMGQSLGAVAALHAAWTRPGTFAGLFLQSGSFFTPELDAQESGFAQWKPITGFVRSLHDATQAAPGAPRTTIVCGTAEENFANNQLMADHLRGVGVTVGWGTARDGHTWTCWRDLLDPHLTDLLGSVWS